MKTLLSILFISFCSLTSLGQSDAPIHLTWEDLEKVGYEDVYLDSIKAWYWWPKIGPLMEQVSGKNVIVEGYLLNWPTLTDTLQVLSEYKNMDMGCFGLIGPSDLIDVGLGLNIKEFFGELVVVRGVFHLNREDIYGLTFILENPKVVKK